MDTGDVDPEVRVREERVAESRRVGEVEGDEQGEDGEGDGETEGAEAVVDVLWVDDAVPVTVPEEDVPLEGGGWFPVYEGRG